MFLFIILSAKILSTFSCHCDDPHLKNYVDNDHDPILTGSLKIINNLQFNELMKNGTKYRLPSDTNVNTIIKQLACDLDLLIYRNNTLKSNTIR